MNDYKNDHEGDSRDENFSREFYDFLARLNGQDETSTFAPVEPRIELVKKLFVVTKLIFKGADRATLKFNDPVRGMGVISLEGRYLKCIMPDYLVCISKAADNIDIYPKLNGSVRFDFCFYGCEVKVKR